MIYPVFFQDLRVAVNQAVLLCVAVSTRKEGVAGMMKVHTESKFAKVNLQAF